jgi:Cd2+/Zn2+-exporting ATPase
LFAIGEALEGYTADRARQTIRSLMQVAPSTATRLQVAEGQMVERRVAVTDLLVSDRIIIHPGERIPMDGVVLIGESAVNQAAITGESLPVEKTIESMVYAGSINGHGSLEVEVTHLAKDNTISRMIRLVEEAQEKRAPSQRFVDRFAKVYTPLVTLLALLVVVIPTVFFGQPLFNPAPGQFGWLYRGLALLVVACPCALVISTPVSIISAINNAARHQVLVKGGAALEMLSRVKVIGLDKTGTVTLGDPQVVRIRAMDCRNGHENGVCTCDACQDLLAVAAALEKRSEHPLGKAIVKAADEYGLGDRYTPGLDVKALAGMGIRGRVDGQMVYIASHAICDDEDCHPQEDCEAAAADAGSGGTPVLVHVDDVYRGTITLADTVRPSSRQAVNELHMAGLKVEMLTGDQQATAEHIARMAGLNGVRAGLLPEGKVNAVRQLREKYGRVAMVGDGINDAPALAAADVGIAMGGANGTAQAMEAGDITLMSADLGRLPYAIQLSRSAMNTIRVNVVLSIGIKLAFMALVVLGLGTMWMAVLADMGTSLLVTLNGMRLLGSSDAG